MAVLASLTNLDIHGENEIDKPLSSKKSEKFALHLVNWSIVESAKFEARPSSDKNEAISCER